MILPPSIEETIACVAPSVLRILLTGPPGVGKTTLAEEIHRLSGRRGAFVTFDCGAQQSARFEAELFGHERGAYTGAERARRGHVAEAEGGTLFFDEVGELSREDQGRLLGFLGTLRWRPLGAETSRVADVRIIAATHHDPRKVLRPELYDRLAEVVIPVPPLDERPAELLALADERLEHWLRHYDVRTPVRLTTEARAALLARRWPGNVRELDQALHRAVVRARREGVSRLLPHHLDLPRLEGGQGLHARLSAFERLVMEDALAATEGNVAAAARLLGISRSGWYERAKGRGGSRARR